MERLKGNVFVSVEENFGSICPSQQNKQLGKMTFAPVTENLFWQ